MRAWLHVLLVGLASYSLLGISGCQDKQDDAAGPLIQAFQSGCASKGSWTDAALGHSQAMIGVIEQLRATKACEPYKDTLLSIQTMSTQVSSLLQNPNFANYRTAEEKVTELTQTLAAESDPAQRDALATALVGAKVDLASMKAQWKVGDENAARDRYVQATGQLSQAVQGMLSQSRGLSDCLSQSPAAAVQLATNLLSLGGSFVSPIYGAAISAVGSLLSLGVQYASVHGEVRALDRLHGAEMPTALACGLESMTELYCQAGDAFTLLDFQSSSYPGPGQLAHPIWEGMDLLGRRLPVLNAWLLKLKNGVTPNDSTEASRQNRVWQKVYQLDTTNRDVVAELRYASSLYDAALNSEAKSRVVLQYLVGLAYGLVGDPHSSGPNPFSEYTGDTGEYACRLALGFVGSCPQKDPNEGVESYIKRFHMHETATIAAMQQNWGEVLRRVTDQVNIEFGQTITADPSALLGEAIEPVLDNVSPKDVLVMLRRFLNRMITEDDGTNPNKKPLLQDTVTLVSSAIDLLVKTDETDVERIRLLFDSFRLRQGLQFFNERVERVINWDIRERLRKGDLPHDVGEILRAAGGDVRERLLASGVRDLVRVKEDLLNAQSISEQNIQIFRKFFEPSFEQTLKQLHQAAIDSGEPVTGRNRPNGERLAKLCLMLLTSGREWPKDVKWSYCSQAVLHGQYDDPADAQPRPPGDPTIGMTLELGRLRTAFEAAPFQQKMCVYHKFLRANRMAEILRQALPPGQRQGEGAGDGRGHSLSGFSLDVLLSGPTW